MHGSSILLIGSSLPDKGQSLAVPTAPWLWPFSHPFISWGVAAAGIAVLMQMPSPQSRGQRAIERVVVFTALLLGLVMLAPWSGCAESDEKPKPRRPEPKIQKAEAIEIASERAKELGYNPDKMTVECAKTDGEFIIDFMPQKDQLGGDLTVKIDASTGEVTEVLRGQ